MSAKESSLKRPVGAKTVDEYLAQVPEAERKVLARLRAQIKAAAPQAQETISYQMPTYKLHGPLIHFAVQPKHLALYGPSVKVLGELKKELGGFDVKGRTIHFSAANPLPAGLVKRIVESRVKENLARKK